MMKILIIENENLTRQAVADVCASIFDHCMIIGAPTVEYAQDLLGRKMFDLVTLEPWMLFNADMDNSDWLEALTNLISLAPRSNHVLLTRAQILLEDYLQIGVSVCVSKVGLNRTRLASVLKAAHCRKFVIKEQDETVAPDIYFSGLTQREQEIISLMILRRPGMKRKDVYEIMSHRCNIDISSAEKYFKRARAKLQEKGPLPQGL